MAITSSPAGVWSGIAKTQSIASSGPAIKPSRDIVTCQRTFPDIALLLPCGSEGALKRLACPMANFAEIHRHVRGPDDHPPSPPGLRGHCARNVQVRSSLRAQHGGAFLATVDVATRNTGCVWMWRLVG
jgi:hypothetical protein